MKVNEIKTNKPKKGYIAYVLSQSSRDQLSKIFPPKYSDFIGHHITYKFGVLETDPLPDDVKNARVIGYSTDNKSLETLVVELDGTSTRLDGKVYHITWSLDRAQGRKPVDSNKVIKEFNWESVAPIDIDVKPGFFRT